MDSPFAPQIIPRGTEKDEEPTACTCRYCTNLPSDSRSNSFTDEFFSSLRAEDPEYDDYEHLIDLTTNQRYIQTRIPVRKDANPRGKYPRKPLPWSAAKLSRVTGWDEDADLYRKHLWREQQKQTKETKQPHNHPLQTANHVLSSTTPPKLKKPRKRINNPHYLTALDAMSKHQGNLRYYVGCSCCYDSARIEKIRDYKREWLRRCIDGLWEVEFEYMIYDDVSCDFEDWRLRAWPGGRFSHEDQRISPDDISMDRIVQSREEAAYRVRYRVGKGRKGWARREALEVGSEGEGGSLTALTRGNISKQVGYDGCMHQSNGSEDEWNFLDGESDDGGRFGRM